MAGDAEIPAGMQQWLVIGQPVEQRIGEIRARRGVDLGIGDRLRFGFRLDGLRGVDGQRLRLILPGLVGDRGRRRGGGLMGNFPRLTLRLGGGRLDRFLVRLGIDGLFPNRFGRGHLFRQRLLPQADLTVVGHHAGRGLLLGRLLRLLDGFVPGLAGFFGRCSLFRLLRMNGRLGLWHGLDRDIGLVLVLQSLGLVGGRFLVLLFGLVRLGRRFLPGRRIVLIGKVFLVLAGCGQGLGMFVLDLGDRQLELVELAAQHVFRRARLHAFELALDGSARLFVNLHPHLWSIFGQPIHGAPNDCCKICHQVFLMSIGVPPTKLF